MRGSNGCRLAVLVVTLIGLASAHPVAGQLGARPADEWAMTLESGQRVVDMIGLEAGEVVADIEAGTGVFSAPIAERVGPGGLVITVEVDPGFLPIILDHASRADVSNVRAVLGEFEDPKLPRNDIDVASSSTTSCITCRSGRSTCRRWRRTWGRGAAFSSSTTIGT